jgi:hypothetical protein
MKSLLLIFVSFLLFEISSGCEIIGNITATEDITSSLCGLQSTANCNQIGPNILYVGKGYNCTVADGIHFHTVSAAMVRASALTPNATSLITIIVQPGIYAENVVVASNVILSGNLEGTYICGAVSWNASVGINAGYIGTSELVYIEFITIGAVGQSIACGSLTINTLATTVPGAEMSLTFVIVQNAVDANLLTVTFFDFNNCNFGSLYIAGGQTLGEYSSMGGTFITGIDAADLRYSVIAFLTATGNTNTLELRFVDVLGLSNFTSSTVIAVKSLLNTIQGYVGSILYLSSTSYTSLVADSTTTVDRDVMYQSSTSTGAPGTNTVTFAIPYINAPSLIVASQTTGGSCTTVAAPIIVAALSTTGFTYQSAVANNCYTIGVFLTTIL